jgi:hypothetical protein
MTFSPKTHHSSFSHRGEHSGRIWKATPRRFCVVTPGPLLLSGWGTAYEGFDYFTNATLGRRI